MTYCHRLQSVNYAKIADVIKGGVCLARIFKYVIFIVIITIMFISALPVAASAEEYEPRLTSPSGEPYYTSELNVYSQTGYGMPNCVAYAYGRLYELNGTAPKLNRGDAGQWWYINKSNGYYEYGDEPQLGAVACWSNHVAVVEEIADDGSVTVSESHWGGKYFNTTTFADMASHYGQAFYGYIYAYTAQAEKEAEEEVRAIEDVFSDDYFEPQEKDAFTALEFARSDNKIMNPANSFILNK